jgi:glycosyltransferase involved in cell wall biosynthesis
MPSRETPVASVLVAAHNAGRFLDATIQSALAQTFANFELIVVDDGSTDDTVSRMRSVNDPRLRIIEQAQSGAPAAMNTALCAARGGYVGFLDHDDLWEPTKLAKHVELLERNPELDLTFSWSRMIDECGRDIGPHPAHWRGHVSFRQFLEDNPMGNTSTLVLRRSAVDAVGGFDTSFPRYYDFDLVLSVVRLRPGNACAIPEELTVYRKHHGQMSGDWRAMRREWEAMLEKFRRLEPRDAAAAEARARSNRNWYFALLAYRSQEFRPAWSLVLDALRAAPYSLPSAQWQWKVAAGCLMARILPGTLRVRLERLAGMQRG